MGEVVIVSCAKNVPQGWLSETLQDHASKREDRSLLLTDMETVHPILEARWGEKNIAQFMEDGRRLRAGQPDALASWIEEQPTKPAFEERATALCRAAYRAKEKGFSVRFIILHAGKDPLALPEETSDLLFEGAVTLLADFENVSVFGAHLEETVIWLDTETTGRDTTTSAVIEIAALRTDGPDGPILDTYEKRGSIPQWAKVEPMALEINGFNKRWHDCVVHHDLYDSFLAWLPSTFTPAGHNVTFDQLCIKTFVERYRLKMPGWCEPTIDTLPMARKLLRARGLVENCKLGTLVKHFGITAGTLHGARADIEATREVYLRLRELETAL